jgi:DNA replication protein DnaC
MTAAPEDSARTVDQDIHDFVLGMRDRRSDAMRERANRHDPGPTVEARHVVLPTVPERFHGITLDDFNVEISGSAYVAQLSAARRAVSAWVELVAKKRPACVALIGSPGNGKSTLLWGAVRALWDRNIGCFARPWYRLADELRYGGSTPWNPDAKIDAHILRALAFDADTLVLDEVCATANTLFDESELGKLVKNAYDCGQPLLITTNVNPLSSLMGDAAADRFTQVHLTAPSRRGAA